MENYIFSLKGRCAGCADVTLCLCVSTTGNNTHKKKLELSLEPLMTIHFYTYSLLVKPSLTYDIDAVAL